MSLASLRAVKCKMTLCFKALHERSKLGLFFFFNVHALRLKDFIKGKAYTVLQKLG